jgi:hypothetical protein
MADGKWCPLELWLYMAIKNMSEKTSWSSPGIAAPRQTPLGHEVDPHKMDDDGVILNAGAGPGLQIS